MRKTVYNRRWMDGAAWSPAAFRQRLSDEERPLAERRAAGPAWAAIAAEMGGTAQSRRKQLERAVERVARAGTGRGRLTSRFFVPLRPGLQ